MKSIPAAVVLGIIALAVAVKFLPWWGSVLLILALAVIGERLTGGLFRRIVLNPFKMKGTVLKDATVEVHSIVPLPPPAHTGSGPDEVHPQAHPGPVTDVAEAGGSRRLFELEVTITPPTVSGQPPHWEPAALQLVDPGYDPNQAADNNEESVCTVLGVQVDAETPEQLNAGCKFSGSQRLRLLVAAPESVRELKFRYYLETFGYVSLTEPLAKAA